MDFNFTEEQTLLRNTVQAFLRDKYSFDQRNKMLASASGRNPAIWEEFAQLGLLGASLPEEFGGLGGGPVETMIIAQEFGAHLVIEPYISSVVVCANWLVLHADSAQKALVEDIIAGKAIWALAHTEPQSRFSLHNCTTSAKADGAGWILNGEKSVVWGAPFSDYFIVSARTSGKPYDREGLSLFIVKADASGVASKDYPTVDGGRASEISFHNVKLDKTALLGKQGNGLALLEEAQDYAIAALCAESIGCMARTNALTGEYCKTRTQFGVPLGSFQALQHRMVDMFIAYEQSLSLTYMITLKLDQAAATRSQAASAAKAYIGQAGRKISQEAVQLHGGMGMSEEMSVGHYLKRITMIDAQFGNVDYHLRRFAQLTNS